MKTTSSLPHCARTGAIILVAGLALAGCGDNEEGGKAATQSVARVNSTEITVHQLNQVLTRLPGVAEEDAPRVRQEVLERLIDQQLAVGEALAQNLDRQPEVMAALEAARREVLARAYLDRLVGAEEKPTAEAGRQYYKDHPELFAMRRVYNLQEIILEKNDAILPALREQVAAAKSMDDIAAWLRSRGVRFGAQGGARPAEQIPLDALAVLHPARDGETVIANLPQGIAVMRIVASQNAPVDEATALPRIMQFLGNQRGKERVEAEIKRLRAAAKIEYLGDFADRKPPVATQAAPAAPAPAPATGDAALAVGKL